MTDPKRWLQGAGSTEVLDLLQHAEAPLPISEQARARSHSRVAMLAALPVAAGISLWLPQVALGAVLGVVGTGIVVAASDAFDPPAAPSVSRPAEPARPALPAAPVPSVTPLPANIPAPASAQPAPEAAPARPRSDAPADTTQAPAAPSNSLDREIALLERARRQLSGNPGEALRVLRTHEAEFPGGQLRIEREFLIVDALVRTGNRPAAEARARALEAQAPRTLYGERLKRILSGQ